MTKKGAERDKSLMFALPPNLDGGFRLGRSEPNYLDIGSGATYRKPRNKDAWLGYYLQTKDSSLAVGLNFPIKPIALPEMALDKLRSHLKEYGISKEQTLNPMIGQFVLDIVNRADADIVISAHDSVAHLSLTPMPEKEDAVFIARTMLELLAIKPVQDSSIPAAQLYGDIVRSYAFVSGE